MDLGWGTGFAIIMLLVLVGVIIYTIKALRKQVSEREREEEEKPRNELGEKDSRRSSGSGKKPGEEF